jgi:hypothetical protein
MQDRGTTVADLEFMLQDGTDHNRPGITSRINHICEGPILDSRPKPQDGHSQHKDRR